MNASRKLRLSLNGGNHINAGSFLRNSRAQQGSDSNRRATWSCALKINRLEREIRVR
jgi:hypothetical protein